MRSYIVQWNYRSSLGGPWTSGERVELDPTRAADINRDSPGVLVEDVPDTAPLPFEPEPRAVEAPPADRQMRRRKVR